MHSLKNHILISMPHMQDPYFGRAVVFLCEHNKEGAMGLIMNKPFEDLELEGLFSNFFDDQDDILKVVPKIYFGGPIMVERGVVLHHSEYQTDESIRISDEFSMTSSKAILQDISTKSGPSQFRLALGHSGWSQGQLEREIANGDWLLQETSPDFIFNTPEDQMWKAATRSFGIDLNHFSGMGGQA